MTIQLTPEDERLVRQRIESGAFRTVEEVIHDALASQASETEWLSESAGLINARIATGLEQLANGQGIPGEAARARLQHRKRAWLAAQQRGRAASS